jgi:hypothetical protein
MIDLWNVPPSANMTDVITARVADGVRHAFDLLRYTDGPNSAMRKNIVRDLKINRDTLAVYLRPVLDDRYRIISGPTKISVFHSIMARTGVRPSQYYEAAETARSQGEFLRRVNVLVLGDLPAPAGPVVLPLENGRRQAAAR